MCTVKKVAGIACLAIGLWTTAHAENDGVGVMEPADATPGSLASSRGVVFCTAAVNSDGSIAGGFGVNRTFTPAQNHPSTGVYNVRFVWPCVNVQAKNGWTRWTQVDTLQAGTTNGSCKTADLAIDPTHGVWVNCEDETGARADRSFFLFLAR